VVRAIKHWAALPIFAGIRGFRGVHSLMPGLEIHHGKKSAEHLKNVSNGMPPILEIILECGIPFPEFV
jgi:hypothetical protein